MLFKQDQMTAEFLENQVRNKTKSCFTGLDLVAVNM